MEAGRAASFLTPHPQESYLQINHVGLFDDPSVSHAKGGDFFFAAEPQGGKRKFHFYQGKVTSADVASQETHQLP